MSDTRSPLSPLSLLLVIGLTKEALKKAHNKVIIALGKVYADIDVVPSYKAR
jgi:hypothetical protein